MAELTAFQKFMVDVYLTRGADERADRIIATLKNPTFDWRENDDQFRRELRCGRLSLRMTLEIYAILIDKHGYRMETADISQMHAIYCFNNPDQR
jgi:hypothetical protein